MSQVCLGLKRSGKCSFGKKLIEWTFCPDSTVAYGGYRKLRLNHTFLVPLAIEISWEGLGLDNSQLVIGCMHTRGSKKSSPLAFDPEIERTLSRNRVLLRENKVIGSPTTPKNIMDPPILTTGQTLPTTTPPIPSSPITNESKPTNTTFPTSTLPPNPLSYQTASTFPPFSHFFPTQGQSSSQQSQPFPFQQDPPITFTTPVQQQQPPSRFQYQQSPAMPFMRVQDDGFDGGYEDEYEGYDEGEYTLGGNGNQTGFQGGVGFVRKPQDIPQAPQGQPRQAGYYQQSFTVVIPQNNQGRTFEVRTNSLQSLPKYKGLATKKPYFHLEAYDSICNTIGGQGFSSDEVKLVLFQFSLEDKAKRWFYTLPSASIYTWAEMQQRFLEEFFMAQKTNDARRSFQQQKGEMFHEAFERFNLMIKNFPHHGIELWELLNAFHEGLNSEDARDLNGGCLFGGVVEGQYEGVNAIQGQGQGGGGRNYNMNSNTYRPGLRNHPNFRYGNPANQSNPNFQGAPQSNFVPRQPYANQGNQGYQRQYQQQTGGPGPSNSSGNEVMDMLRMMQQDMQRRNQLDEVRMQKDEVRDKSIQSLTTHMGQLATEVAELKKGKGQLLSDTKVNPSHSSSRNIPINHVSVLRSGKEFKANLSPGLVDGVVEDITGNESDEDEISPSIVSKDLIVEKEIKKPGLGEILKDKNKEGGPSQVPFPSALIGPELCTQKRQQKVPKQVNLTERVSAVLKGDLPPKLQDPGTPLINIQVGNFQMSRALLDLGAGVSILPGGLYDQYEFGPLKRVETTVVLADLSHKLPRGIVRDVIVKVEEFYYPVDFLVLDYSSVDPSQQQNVILGRPFLNTAHAIIDCRYGTVDMTFGNRKMRLNVFTNVSNSLGGDECFMADLVDRCDPHEYEEDVLKTCVCDFSEQVQVCALRMEEIKQEALAVREGRPPWTHQIESLPFAFLGDNDTLPVIIASNLEKAQEQALLKVLKVLKANKEAIGWTIADLKGIRPSIVMHKIITTEDAKPTREAQRRLNPNLREVVKKEVIKWLDAEKGMEVDKAKIRVISSLPPPKNVKGEQLVKVPILQPPDWSKPFEIMCDASDTTIGAVLGQRIDKKPVAIYYASKTLSEAQLNYTTTEKELLTVVYALDKFRSYIWGSKVIVYSDHSAVRYLMEKKDAKPRLIRWVLLLQEFDLEIRDKKGS
ncbi:hypothetical protein L1987_15122 [Smallanthus sonchifolius]|uniref:Uncharacterized protein n=1 Tax=Smallanthus sonchifolius TaxID=185202 RepID=A0ACB9J4K9_9ASTR|nr:hypothetical protein L1987_15122 [Smallanthus sonchifolius]